MNKLAYFPFFPADFLSSSTVQLMSLEEQGAFTRLLCFAWDDGSIPADISKIARLCGVSTARMKVLWSGPLASVFTTHPTDPERLVNERQEQLRQEQAAKFAKKVEAGRLGGINSGRKRGEANGKQTGSSASNLLQAKPNENEPSITISINNPPIAPPAGGQPESNQPPATPPPAETHAPRIDAAYEEFRMAFELQYAPAKYQRAEGDFVRLAALREAQGIGTIDTPPLWDQAIAHYLASPMGKHTLADLCARFATFVVSPLDKYKNPTAPLKRKMPDQPVPVC